MRSLLIATALLACSCASPTQQQPPADLHTQLAGGRSQITPVFASHQAMTDAVTAAVAAQSLQVLKTETGEAWGRVSAVDERGVAYVLSWEPSADPAGNFAPCLLLFISCGPGDGTVAVGQLAEAVRAAAERKG